MNTSFLIVAIAAGLLGLAALSFMSLYVRERRRRVASQVPLAAECADLAEGLGKLTYGLLDQRIEGRLPQGGEEDPLISGIASMRRSFNELTNAPLKRVCFVGTDAWMEGAQCAEAVGTRLGPGTKAAILVTSSKNVLIMAQRSRSFAATLANDFPGIELAGTYEAGADQERARGIVREIAGQVDAIYVTGNSVAPGAAKGLEDAGRAGAVFMLCHDMDVEIASAMDRGAISASLVCSTIGQGREPVIRLFNHIVAGWKPIQPRLISAQELVTRENLASHWDRAGGKPIDAGRVAGEPVLPERRSQRRIRIAVFLEDWNSAFKQMKAGIEEAGRILGPYNAELSLHVLNQVKRPRAEVLAEAEAILRTEAKAGLDGLVSFVGIPELVPLLNARAEKGLPIATFNSEPLSLRSLILWLAQGSVELERFGREYTAGHQEINAAMQEILSAMENMVARAKEEAESAGKGAEAVSGLLSLVDAAAIEEERQAGRVGASSEIGARLSGMVDFLNGKVQGLIDVRENVRVSGTKVEAMGAYSSRIRAIVGIIDDIADRTNLLAFNAAIEASRAGVSGKGFKVLAGEIRDLADKSVASTRDISALVTSMLQAVEESVGAIERTKAIVEEQVESITAAGVSLDELSRRLVETMRDVKASAEDNAAKLAGMKGAAAGMNEAVGAGSRIAADNSLAIGSMGTAFAEMSAQFDSMSAQTKQLGEIVTVLAGTVAQFNAGR